VDARVNKDLIKALVLVFGLTTAGFYEGIPLVTYQTNCTRLQALHEVLIGAVDPRL
jgi:hypothetical protein